MELGIVEFPVNCADEKLANTNEESNGTKSINLKDLILHPPVNCFILINWFFS